MKQKHKNAYIKNYLNIRSAFGKPIINISGVIDTFIDYVVYN